MSDNRGQDPRYPNDSDPGDGTRISSVVPTSIAPVSVSTDSGETTRNIVIGALLNHTYRVEALLARGGMGEVYRATHVELGTEHAIKVILPELTDNTKVVDMFRREAASLRNVRDDAVVAYDGVFRDEHGRLYLVMEFVSGPSLSDRLRQGALSADDTLMLRDRIAGGLAAAHEKGIIHRDMSPDNVILPGGRLDHAKILDFGIAKLTDPDAKTIIGDDFAGKYSYVSPEQLGMFGGIVDARSDIYSVGLVLAAAVRGRPLDMGMSPLAVVEARRSVPDLSDIPELVRGPLAHMLQPDPKDRPQTMAEIIGAVGSGGGSTAQASAKPEPTNRPRQAQTVSQKSRPPHNAAASPREGRSVVGLALGVGFAAMLAGGVGYYFLLYRPAGETVLANRTEAPRLAPASSPQLTPAAPSLTPAPSLSPAPSLTSAPSLTATAAPDSAQITPAAPEPPSAPASLPPRVISASPGPPLAPPLAPTSPTSPPPAPSSVATLSPPVIPASPSPPGASSSATPSPAPSARIQPPPAPASPPLPQITAPAPPLEAAASPEQQTAMITPPPPVTPPAPQTAPTPAVAAPPSAAEIRRSIDRVIRSFSCARLDASSNNGVWTVSGFVATPQDLGRLQNELAAAGVPAPRVEAEIVQRPLCEVAELLHASTAVRRENGGVRIGLNSPGRTYRDGEQLIVDVTSQAAPDRFLYVSYVDKDGNILHLLPKPGRVDNKAAPGKIFRFGQEKEYMISEPFGTDMIIAVASPARLFDSVRPETEPGPKYLADLQASLRKVNPSGSTGPIVSNYILITTSP